MKLRPADAVWSGIAVAAFAHNVWATARQREQLSEAMDRYRAATPVVEIAMWVVAGHLTRRLPVAVDPLHGLYVGSKILARHRGARRIVLGFLAVQLGVYVALCGMGDT